MDKKAFAKQIYEFLKDNDKNGHYENDDSQTPIAEIEDYLSDLPLVRETIKDIEEISDTFDDHEIYVAEVKPLLEGLREIEEKLEAKEQIRMVSDTAYEVKHGIHVGDKEILFAVDEKAENGMCYFVGNYTCNDLIGQYSDCMVSDDFLEAMQEFTERVSKQIEMMRNEISQSKMPHELFTAEHCYPNDYSQSIEGKIVAIKAAVFRPEYCRGDVQLVLVTGGNGARANPHGNAVFCNHLHDGKRTRFERYEVLGEVRAECLPPWAKEKSAAIQAEKSGAEKYRDKER